MVYFSGLAVLADFEMIPIKSVGDFGGDGSWGQEGKPPVRCGDSGIS